MRYILVVDEPEDYQKWLATQEPWLKVNPDYISKVPERLRSLLPFELAPAKTETPADSTAKPVAAPTDSLSKVQASL